MAIAFVNSAALNRFHRQCKGKLKHATMGHARAHVERMTVRVPNDIFEFYQCPWCSYYHIGHRLPKAMAAKGAI